MAPRFRDVEAAAGIDLRIEPGELLAFIGPNGAGKSITIKMLTGILYPLLDRPRCSAWCNRVATIVMQGAMFHGWLRVLLFTAIPAGFIQHCFLL